MTEFQELDLENQLIQTEDEDGNFHNFELIDIIEVDEQEYGILLYVDDKTEEEAEEQELAIMRLIKDDEGYIFETIEDEEEFEKVSSFVEAELNADLDDEEEDEEE